MTSTVAPWCLIARAPSTSRLPLVSAAGAARRQAIGDVLRSIRCGAPVTPRPAVASPSDPHCHQIHLPGGPDVRSTRKGTTAPRTNRGSRGETTGRCRGRAATFGGRRHPEPADGGGGESHLRAGGSRPRLGAHRGPGHARFDTGIAPLRRVPRRLLPHSPGDTGSATTVSPTPHRVRDHHLKSPPVVMRPHQIPPTVRGVQAEDTTKGATSQLRPPVRSAPFTLRDTPPV
jgi:hypothetical protein